MLGNSSNLPPGCTNADIEYAFGDRPDILEAFKAAHKGKLTSLQEEQLATGALEEDVSIVDLIEKFFTWASAVGKQSIQEDEGMYANYLIGTHINPVLFRTNTTKAAAIDILKITRRIMRDGDPRPDEVKNSDYGCANCLWHGIECQEGSKYEPCMPVYEEAECRNYTFYD